MKKNTALVLAQAAVPTVSQVISVKSIARLWGGMGSVIRVQCDSIDLIIKVIECRNPISHGDLRKAASYVVECNFYMLYSQYLCDSICCKGLHCANDDRGNITIVMTPLPHPTMHSIEGEDSSLACLRSIAHLHAYFWGEKSNIAVSNGLAEQGGYWYLDTRPDEYSSMSKHGLEGKLRNVARGIDRCLKDHPYQTCLHGDLKVRGECLIASREKNNFRFIAL
uniref:Protein kinase domain-containing protein n=1 Tax=Proboscia inermis TaxID=420281 RepID=A0A7S0GJU8_9STRA|mmetsp:Transcript_49888/g.50252  ORF Transcript_49888/g.50252 Transcript_49888/m.50252 type:complete len:223 (+) Transcript_49888:64-732(+)